MLHEPQIGAVDVALVGVRERRGLEVRALDDPQVGLERQQALQIAGVRKR